MEVDAAMSRADPVRIIKIDLLSPPPSKVTVPLIAKATELSVPYTPEVRVSFMITAWVVGTVNESTKSKAIDKSRCAAVVVSPGSSNRVLPDKISESLIPAAAKVGEMPVASEPSPVNVELAPFVIAEPANNKYVSADPKVISEYVAEADVGWKFPISATRMSVNTVAVAERLGNVMSIPTDLNTIALQWTTCPNAGFILLLLL